MRLRIALIVIMASACGDGAVTTTTAPVATSTPTTEAAATTATTTPTATITTTTTTTTAADAMACRDDGCLATSFDYLVVTRPMFVDALQAFATWKTAAGHTVGLVTVDWLAATYAGDHLAEQVKTGLHDLAGRSGLRWVLLVGDTEMTAWDFSIESVLRSYDLDEPWSVPTGYYRRIASDPPGDVLPSDAYFVEDRDWDVTADGLNARPDDLDSGEGTLHATVFLGRWPVRTADQVRALTDKTMAATPADRVLFTADASLTDGTTTSCSSWPPGPFQEFFCSLDSMVTARTVFFEAAAPHLVTDSRFPSLDDTTSDDEALAELLSYSGAVVASYHGNYQCWGLLEGQCLGADRVVFEGVIPLLEAEACLIGTFYFDAGESLAESMLLSPTGPAVFTQAPNPARFLEALRHGTPVGEAFWATAGDYLYWPNPITILGDPSLVVVAGP